MDNVPASSHDSLPDEGNGDLPIRPTIAGDGGELEVHPTAAGSPLLLRSPAPLLLIITALLILTTVILLDMLGVCAWPPLCGPLTADDIVQGRLDTALPAPQGDLWLEQSFVPRRNGLNEIELLLARYGGEMPPGAEPSRLTVEVWDETGALVAAESLSTAALTHNQTYTLRFAPQNGSTGRRYVLRLSGSPTNHFSVWGYSTDIYEAGAARLINSTLRQEMGELEAQDMRFTTRYALTAGDALAAAVAPLGEWRLLLAALLYLPLPGVLLLLLVRPRGWDGAAWLGAALALGVAAWPVVWLWLSLAGGRWSGGLLWGTVLVGWGAAALIAWRRQTRTPGTTGDRPQAKGRRNQTTAHVLLGGLLLVTLASRFVAVRDQAFPPWVDSSRHGLITAVMVAGGQTPDGYAPYLPVDHFPYHFGFHTLSAGLSLMTAEPLPGLLLLLMQLLGGLLPLTVYSAGWMVTRRRAVGLLGAFLVALPFFFPGYYATWGRMTQLAAMVVMPVLLALTWRVGRGRRPVWPLVGVLAAGLFLIHFRVFLFYLPFAALVAVAVSFKPTRTRWLGGLLLAGGLALLLVVPRLAALVVATDPLATFQQSLPGYNDFPTGYLTTGWERLYVGLAAVAAAVVVVAAALRRRWATFPLLLLLWVGVLFALLAGERLGLPETLVVNLNSMYITLFLPLALLLSIVVGRITNYELRMTNKEERSVVSGQLSVDQSPVSSLRSAVGGRRPAVVSAVAAALAVLAGAALALLLLFGWRQQVNILNRQTILAVPEDVAALAWIDANLPAEARVAVNAWQWLGQTWAAGDGGAWLLPLTGRAATTPPIDHIYNRELFAAVRAFNEPALAVEDWSDPAAAAWLAEQGVTHVFVGQRGGFFDPAELSRNPALELLYRREGTFVFGVTSDE